MNWSLPWVWKCFPEHLTEVTLTTALGFRSMTSSIESLERPERAHELVTSLSVEVFPGALQTEQKIGSWREALENEMNLKYSEGYHKTVGSKYLAGSSAAPYCNSKYPTHLAGIDARTALFGAEVRETVENV